MQKTWWGDLLSALGVCRQDFVLGRNQGRMNVVRVRNASRRAVKFHKEQIMENQKSNDGSARDLGREGAGSSMGKDMGRSGSTGSSGTTGNSGSGSGSSSGSVIDKAKDIARDLTKDLPASATDMHKTIDKAADAAQPVVDRLASSAHAGVDKVSGALAGASKSMDEKTRQLTDAARNFADTGREYVRSSPATSVLAALGAGYILAKILGSRR
jgi:ElaB/YqjD/DUF883 family membrane-anchored ribosome-binding protein